MCLLDDAQKLEELERSHALKRQLNKSNFNLPSEKHCVRCGVDIPEERRALGGVTRCIECQIFFEERGR